jgi:EAL domain-containing protein (putative c-di-GMP-specific phosphodiesterase class I)
LRSEACDEAQGYLLGRPIPVGKLAAEGGPQAEAQRRRYG